MDSVKNLYLYIIISIDVSLDWIFMITEREERDSQFDHFYI